MKHLLSAVLLVSAVSVGAADFSLESLDLAGLRAIAVDQAPVRVPAPRVLAVSTAQPVKRFTIVITRVCDAGLLVVASWCPTPGTGVVGGLEREIVVSAGDDVELLLVNPSGIPDYTAGIGDHSFQLTAAEPIESCSGEACNVFGARAYLPLGSRTTVRFKADRAGRYKYWDGLWHGGYGVLNVLPKK